MGKALGMKLAIARQRRMEAHAFIRAAQARGVPAGALAGEAVTHLMAMSPKPRRLVAERIVRGVLSGLSGFALPADGSVPAWVRRLVASARSRDAARGRANTLAEADVVGMFMAQQGRCAVSGLPFSAADDRPGALVSRPFAPSLDRKDTTRGYEPENVRLVCVAANFAMNSWGLDVLVKLADGVRAVQGNATRPDGATGHGAAS